MVAADGNRDGDHRLEQLDSHLFLALVDALDARLLALERPGDDFDDVALGDAGYGRRRGFSSSRVLVPKESGCLERP